MSANSGETPAEKDGAAAPAMKTAEADWGMANKDYANTRATTASKINSNTVHSLGIDWSFHIPGTGAYGAAATAPLVVGDVVYFQDMGSNLFALNLSDGQVKWKQMQNFSVVGPNGPGLGYGKVFAHSGPNTMKAFDMDTGKELWTSKLSGPAGSHQPYVFDNIIFTGTAAGEVDAGAGPGEIAMRGYAGGTSGCAYAVDQQTGKMVWNFQVVQDNYWGNPKLNSGGGVWYSPAIDTKTGLTFWGTGNPAPFPGVEGYPNGTSRPGKNLYSSSILAIDHKTGELKWYKQLVEHDLFDHDAQISPVLATAHIHDQDRDIVIGGGKLGVVVALDRNTGEELWRVTVGEHLNDHLKELPEGQVVTVKPGVFGGVITPMALADNTLFVPVLNLSTPFSATGYELKTGTEAVQKLEGLVDLNQGSSEMLAIDIDSGVVLWQHRFDKVGFGAATVVNDLVFTSTYDGVVHALSRSDGSEVWSLQLPGGINGWPAVTEDRILFPVGISGHPVLAALKISPEGHAPGGGQKEPQASKQAAPAMEAQSAPGAPPARTQADQKLSDQQQQLLEQGRQIYMQYASRCHQPTGAGMPPAIPQLANSKFVTGDATQVIHMVLTGEGAMPAMGKLLSDQQVAAVVSYIRNAWGNNAQPVTAEQVKAARSSS